MAFNALEYLKDGNVDFVFNVTPYDFDSLVSNVRNSPNKYEIIVGFLPKLLHTYKRFCFKIIYDDDEFELETKKLFSDGCWLESDEQIFNFLNNTTWGKDYFFENIEFYIPKIKDIPLLFKYIFDNYDKCQNYIDYFRIHKNLHLRYRFIYYVIINHPDLLDRIYDNVLDYLTSFTHQEYEQLTFLPELMDTKDVSQLAFAIFESKLKKKYYYEMKEYILANYKENDLAAHLIAYKRKYLSDHSYTLCDNEEGIKEFSKDADRLFTTSRTDQFHIYTYLPDKVSKEILDSFAKNLAYYRSEDSSYISKLFNFGLGRLLFEYVDKYLSLSEDKTYEFIESGSTGCVYRFGEYAIKLFRTKWSYEDVICPNLYLINKNLEEHYVRNEEGIVCAGLEVQKFLKRDAKNVPQNIFIFFERELSRLGYKRTDTLMNGPRGDNCRMLDSYKDADCTNPESLPDWFKEYPVVLVDRDRIYDKSLIFIKQLREYL